MKHFLIVVDMQNDFVDGALGTEEAVKILPNVVRKIEEFEGPVFVTLDTHGEDYLQTAEGRKLPVPHCIKGTEGWKLNEQVKKALDGKTYTVVEKGTFGSVDLPELVETASAMQNFTIELVGLCTDICVVSNALLLKAAFPESEIFVDADCCAGVTPESHRSALTTMQMCHITVKGGK